MAANAVAVYKEELNIIERHLAKYPKLFQVAENDAETAELTELQALDQAKADDLRAKIAKAEGVNLIAVYEKVAGTLEDQTSSFIAHLLHNSLTEVITNKLAITMTINISALGLVEVNSKYKGKKTSNGNGGIRNPEVAAAHNAFLYRVEAKKGNDLVTSMYGLADEKKSWAQAIYEKITAKKQTDITAKERAFITIDCPCKLHKSLQKRFAGIV